MNVQLQRVHIQIILTIQHMATGKHNGSLFSFGGPVSLLTIVNSFAYWAWFRDIFFSSLLLPPSNIIANLQRQINIYIYIDIRLRAWAHLSWFWIYVYLDRFVKCFFVMILLVSHTPNSRSQWVQGSIFNAYFFYFLKEIFLIFREDVSWIFWVQLSWIPWYYYS